MLNRISPTVKYLLIVNVSVFLLIRLVGDELVLSLSLYYFDSPLFRPFQLVTYMFLHADFMHLFFNMLSLFFFGPHIEFVWGQKKFLIFYLIVGVGAGLFYNGIQIMKNASMKRDLTEFVADPSPSQFYSYIENYDGYSQYTNNVYESYFDHPENLEIKQLAISTARKLYSLRINIPMLGASGAVYGILMAMGLMFPNKEVYLLFPPIPLKMIYLVTIWGGWSAYNGLFSSPGDNVAHMAHLGGMVISLVLIKFSKQF